MIKKELIAILTVIILSSTCAKAGIEKLIRNVFPSGTMSNVTRSAIVREQEAGHLIGGSVIIKTPAESGLQLVGVQSPSCKLGGLPCGASFELLGGGVSIVSSAELMRHLKGLMQNAGAYGGIMAIKTLCPQCEDIMGWLDSKADWVNNMAKTDCEDMARLADGMLGKITAGARATRQSAAILNGEGRDMADFAAKSKLDNSGRDVTKDTPELSDMLGDNFNLVWKALEKKAPGNNGEAKTLKELLMSISGTVIGTTDPASKKRQFIHKKSLIGKELIEEFIGAGNEGSSKVKLYDCNDQYCLRPAVRENIIKQADSLVGRVGKIISSITEKVQKNTGAFTSDEETLIALSSVPLITKIELDLQSLSNSAGSIAAQDEFIHALCFDVVTNYMAQLLQEVSTAVNELRYVQLSDSGIFTDFDNEIRGAMRMLATAKSDAFKRYDLIMATKGRIRQEINYFNMRFEEFCQSN